MNESRSSTSLKKRFLFGLSAFPDQLTYQAFTILVFTFYFAVVGIDIMLMMFAFIIWGIWNAINDPLLGALSERTKQKGKLGKRKFYLIISIVPLSLMMIFLFTAPGQDLMINFFYFLVIILVFELFYTMFDVNVNAIFPEMFPTEKERASTNMFLKGLTLIAVIVASVVPTLIIHPLVPLTKSPSEVARIKSMYITAGIVLAVITGALSIPFMLFAIDEKEEIAAQFEKRPGFINSLKFTLKNKTFVKFVIANTMIWYCFTILLTVFPLYAVFVLGIEEESFLIGIILMVALLAAALFIPLLKKIGTKFGMRNGLILGLIIWIIALFPLVLLSKGDALIAIIVFGCIGYGLASAIYYIDIIHADVIDQDALKFGVKRSASYYGINAFIHRVSSILSIVTIALVFSGTGWSSYTPVTDNPELIVLGLKLLMFVFPALALIIAILFFLSFELHGENLKKMREELAKHPELK